MNSVRCLKNMARNGMNAMCGTDSARSRGHNSVGVEPCEGGVVPRVARASQPWALGRNAFGVEEGQTPGNAFYVIDQNADPTKEIVAIGQTYFAVQTRRRELSDQEIETQRRLTIRSELRTHNTQLADAAKMLALLNHATMPFSRTTATIQP